MSSDIDDGAKDDARRDWQLDRQLLVFQKKPPAAPEAVTSTLCAGHRWSEYRALIVCPNRK